MARPKQQQKSLKPFYVGLVAVGALGVLAIAYLSGRGGGGAPVTRLDTSMANAADAQGYTYGKPDAPVNIMEFADLSCSHCANWSVVIEPEIRQKLLDSGLARLTYYDFILGAFPNSIPAHNAASCAGEQGKFWEMHDKLYTALADWATVGSPKKLFSGYAAAFGINMDQWEQCFDSQKYQARITANTKLGESLGVGQTPTFVIGDKTLAGAHGYDSLRVYVEAAAKAGAKPAP